VRSVWRLLLFVALCGPVLAEDDVLERALRTIEKTNETLARAREIRARRRHAPRPIVRPPEAVASSAASAGQQIPLPEEAAGPKQVNQPPAIAVTKLKPEDLEDFAQVGPTQRDMIQRALALTGRGLSPAHNSDNPDTGGLDSGGFIQYLLKPYSDAASAPHDPAEIYRWARKTGNFHAVLTRDPASTELAGLVPGDLMFWSTIDAWNQDVPITQVTLYIGKERSSGKPVMVGVSQGSLYHNAPMTGLSVLDVQQSASDPAEDYLLPRLVGYVAIPGLEKNSQ
jgi:hypothetical protein